MRFMSKKQVLSSFLIAAAELGSESLRENSYVRRWSRALVERLKGAKEKVKKFFHKKHGRVAMLPFCGVRVSEL